MKKYDVANMLNDTMTMTEKIEYLNKNFIVIVRPVCFTSKLFNEGQQKRYSSAEKELQGLIFSLLKLSDYIESCPMTFVLTDNQSILWALKSKENNSKLTRYFLRIYELPINNCLCHIAGAKNGISDYLSRIYYCEKPFVTTNPKSKLPKAFHIKYSFPLFSILTMDDLLKAFDNITIEPCLEKDPENCLENVVRKAKFPIEQVTVNQLIQDTSHKITKTMVAFGSTQNELLQLLSVDSLFRTQRDDPELVTIIKQLESGTPKENIGNNYEMKNDILYKKYHNPSSFPAIVVPNELIPIILSYYHVQTHSGAKKLEMFLRKRYYWRSLRADVVAFCKGCLLCQLSKSNTQGSGLFGETRIIGGPRTHFQIDIVTGVGSVRGYIGYLNCVDLFSGYQIPIPIRNETAEHISEILERYILIPFLPQQISSDNASYFQSDKLQSLLRFYNIVHYFTTAYSPTSHSIVEISNRYITQAIRIFLQQYKNTTWRDVIGLATQMCNLTPCKGLGGYSPYFMFYAQEPHELIFGYNIPEDVVDPDKIIIDTMQNKNFARILYEYLRKQRKRNIEKITKKYVSIPVNTLIYPIDHMREQRPAKKIKPIFNILPESVVKEYRSTVYTKDLYGRIHRRPKSDCKIAADRSIKLFGNLPVCLQMLLGGPFSHEHWEKLYNSGDVNKYLASVENEEKEPMTLRSFILSKSHLIGPEPGTEDSEPDLLDNSDITFLDQLKYLHDNQKLTDNLNMADIPQIYKKICKSSKQPVLMSEIDPFIDPSFSPDAPENDNLNNGANMNRNEITTPIHSENNNTVPEEVANLDDLENTAINQPPPIPQHIMDPDPTVVSAPPTRLLTRILKRVDPRNILTSKRKHVQFAPVVQCLNFELIKNERGCPWKSYDPNDENDEWLETDSDSDDENENDEVGYEYYGYDFQIST